MFFGSVDPFRCRLGHDEKRQFQINNGNRRFVEESAESTYRRTQNKHQRNCSKTIIYIIIGMDMCETWDVSREQRMNEPENRTHGALQNTHTINTHFRDAKRDWKSFNVFVWCFVAHNRGETYRAISVCICAWICWAIIRIIITNNLVSVLRSVSVCVVFVSFKCHCFLFRRMKRGSAIEQRASTAFSIRLSPIFVSRFVFFNSIQYIPIQFRYSLANEWCLVASLFTSTNAARCRLMLFGAANSME